MTTLYADILIAADYEEVDPLHFYQTIFNNSSHVLRWGENAWFPVVLSDEPRGEDGQTGTWRKWTLRTILEMTADRSDAYLTMCTYFHSVLNQNQASQLCAFVIDCDAIADDELYYLLSTWESGGVLRPTYVVCSGGGLHLYYVLAEPVDILKRWKEELGYINDYLENQYRGEYSLGTLDRHAISQPYRIVGTRTKNDEIVCAFKVGEPWFIRELALEAGLGKISFIADEYKPSDVSKARKKEIDEARNLRRSKALQVERREGEEGRARHPERVRNFYVGLRAAYVDKSRFYGQVGNRWKQVMCLTIAAAKARQYVSYDELNKDVRDLWRRWNETAKKHHMPEIKWSECQKAMRAYSDTEKYKTFPAGWIAEMQGFNWEKKTKRNLKEKRKYEIEIGRACEMGEWQKIHLEEQRAWRDYKLSRKGMNWWDGAGRPKGSIKESTPKAELVRDYFSKNPNSTIRAAADALGISKTTVQKWKKLM